MGWWNHIFGAGPQTFEQDLELLVARWSDRSRMGREALSTKQIAVGLALKARQLSDEASGKMRPSQGA